MTDPNNDISDQCYIEGKCQFPLSPLLKIVNPKIRDSFPEIYEFLLDFRITTNDLNDIIAIYKNISTAEQYTNMSGHEWWYESACRGSKTQIISL